MPTNAALHERCNSFALRGLFKRQTNLKTCVARFRFKANVAAVFSHDASDGVQPETRSVTDGLGCKERLKDTRPQSLRYPRTVIPDFYKDVSRLFLGTDL